MSKSSDPHLSRSWPIALATVFGLGLIKPGPGTWGSLPPVFAAFALSCLVQPMVVNLTLIALGFAFAVICILSNETAEAHFGGSDAPQIVADEVAGQSIALLFLPWRPLDQPHAILWNASLALAAFLTFRFFDILKPPPIRHLERLRGGWGVLADDLAAGTMALIATLIIAHLVLPGIFA